MKLTVTGQAVSGIGSCLAVQALKVFLDMGVMLSDGHKFPTVFVTHGHTDHVGALMSYVATRDMMNMPPPTLYMPSSLVGPLNAALQAWRGVDPQAKLPCSLVGFDVGDELWLDEDGRKRWLVRPFATEHRMESQGYAFFYVVDKLKDEYKGQNVKLLREQGVEVLEKQESLELAYTGDTTVKVFEMNPWLKDAKKLVMEVTFTHDDVSVEEAHKRGHIHLEELVANPGLLPKGEVVFCHFSRRQDPMEVAQAIVKAKPAIDPEGRVSLLKSA